MRAPHNNPHGTECREWPHFYLRPSYLRSNTNQALFFDFIFVGTYIEKDSERHIPTVFLTQNCESVLWQMANRRMFNDSCAGAGKADSELAPQGEADDIGTFTAFDKVSNHLRRECPVIAE